jgi:hypothetical protein
MLDVFLKTGKHPATLKETSAILDLLRSRILNMNTAPTATAPGKPHTPILDKLAASGGKATLSELGAAARPTTAPSKAPADNLPRTSTGRVDSLEITRRQLDQRQAERKAASDAVSRKNPPRRSFVGKQSKYHVED